MEVVFRLKAWDSSAQGNAPVVLNLFESYLAGETWLFAADAASDGSLG